MKSAYAIRLYELLKQYKKIGERVIAISDLRSYCGIPKEQYPLYADFRVRVIDISKREINGRTDIAFEYEQVKDGRKVVALRFTIARNKGADHSDEIRDDPKLSRLVSRLTAHGIAEEKARA